MGLDFLPKRIKGEYYYAGGSLQQSNTLKGPPSALTCSDIKFLSSLGFKVTSKCRSHEGKKRVVSLKEQN